MQIGYQAFEGRWSPRARLAWNTIQMKPTKGIPAGKVHVMDVPFVEEMTGHAPGDFARDPDGVYLAFAKMAGVCFIDQYIPTNPLSMGPKGYESSTARSATTGAEKVVLDGIEIDSPEAVIEHMERFVFPRRAEEINNFDPDDPAVIERLVAAECAVQDKFRGEILKGPYANGFQAFPQLDYVTYGYANYFMAYGLYPEVIEKHFAQQADLAVLKNTAAARAIVEAGLPKLIRLDHDMADSRGTLVDVKSLDRIWFPHLVRAVQPFLTAGVRLIWHCDGNLMEMVPRLLEAGLGGFQGFQYEDGMQYEQICRMTDRNGEPLLIFAGVSVTTTLPAGSRDDVVRQMRWLVDNGPPRGLFLGASSSITPGTNKQNIRTFIEGLHYYRQHGREC